MSLASAPIAIISWYLSILIFTNFTLKLYAFGTFHVGFSIMFYVFMFVLSVFICKANIKHMFLVTITSISSLCIAAFWILEEFYGVL